MNKKAMTMICMLLSICIFFTACNSSVGASGGTTGFNSTGTVSSGGSATSSSAGVGEEKPMGSRDSTPKVLTPSADGTDVRNGAVSVLDVSNASEGYMMIRYTGSNPKLKLRLFFNGDQENYYTYDLPNDGEYYSYPFSEGSGNYSIVVYENSSGSSYSMGDTYELSVSIDDENKKFLYSNYYVDFDENSQSVKLSEELATGANNDLDVVTYVYEYVIGHMTYDDAKAARGETIYVPNIDEALATGQGICWEYAATMTAMLRAQGIPTQLVVGLAGTVKHAWISVYTPETGWIHDIIEFNGTDWTRMDPTFASTSGSNPGILQYVGDGENYNATNFY